MSRALAEGMMTNRPGKGILNTYSEKTKGLEIGSFRCWKKYEQICRWSKGLQEKLGAFSSKLRSSKCILYR